MNKFLFALSIGTSGWVTALWTALNFSQTRMGAVQSHAILCNPMQSHAVPCNPMQSLTGCSTSGLAEQEQLPLAPSILCTQELLGAHVLFVTCGVTLVNDKHQPSSCSLLPFWLLQSHPLWAQGGGGLWPMTPCSQCPTPGREDSCNTQQWQHSLNLLLLLSASKPDLQFGAGQCNVHSAEQLPKALASLNQPDFPLSF